MKRRVANPGPGPAFLALLLVLVGRAGAQAPVPRESQPLVLGLGAAVRLALEASPSLEGAEAALEAADARRDAASRLRLPSVLASAAYSHAGPVEPGVLDVGPQKVALPEALQDSTSFRIVLQQPLYTGGRLASGLAQAEAGRAAALAEAAARRRDVAAAAERAWWGLVLASESEAAVAENLLAVRAHRADAERRLAEGTATKSELLSWRMQEVEASVRTRSADADRAAARARLNVLLGRSWDAPLETAEEPTMAADGSAAEPTRAAAESTGAAAAAAPEGEASCPDGGAGESGLLATALGSRPELAAARARVEAREAAVGVARSALLPALHLTASAAYADPNPKAFPQRPGFELLWDIGLVASLDLGRLPFARSQVEEARAQAREARGALAQAQDGVALELALAGLELEKARDRLESSSAAVALAEENRRVQEERFAAGIALASELADAESALLLARLDGTRSRVAWELARAALRDAAGGTR